MTMAKENSATKWLQTGYTVFAHEGPDGIQIERIARIMALNKSSFYHYFGTLEIFFEMLVKYHYNRIDVAIKDADEAENFDPDYLDTIVRHKVTFMVQMQLSRHKNNTMFSKAYSKVNEKIDQSVILLWNKHLGLTNNDDVSLLYLGFVRDTIFARISFENFNYHFLHELASEAKRIVEEIQKGKISLRKFETVKSF
jgi:AcrR family transcriptional regulator